MLGKNESLLRRLMGAGLDIVCHRSLFQVLQMRQFAKVTRYFGGLLPTRTAFEQHLKIGTCCEVTAGRDSCASTLWSGGAEKDYVECSDYYRTGCRSFSAIRSRAG